VTHGSLQPMIAAMTEIASDRGAQFIAIEKDRRLAGIAQPLPQQPGDGRLAGTGKSCNPKDMSRLLQWRRHNWLVAKEAQFRSHCAIELGDGRFVEALPPLAGHAFADHDDIANDVTVGPPGPLRDILK
jgi:hypothetical protein